MYVKNLCAEIAQNICCFLWASGWERMSRVNLFHAVGNGGVGLSHLFLKQVVSRFVFFRDQSDAFLRTVIQLRLCDALPDFIVTSHTLRNVAVKGFMREVVDSVRFLRAHFSVDYLSDVSRKKLYKDLIYVMCPTPIYRSAYHLGQERNVLKRVKGFPVKASTKTFFFMLHCGTLPVKPWLQEKGIFVPGSVNCIICKKPETIEHIFLNCWDSIFLWDILQRTLKKDLPLTPFGIRFLPVEQTEMVPYDLIMLLCMHSLWRTRMAVRNADQVARPAKEYFVENIVYVRDAYRSLCEPPEWLWIFDHLTTTKYL